MSEDGIRQTLADSRVGQHQLEEILTRLVRHGKKIFGVLVQLDYAALVCQFIEPDQFEDAKLPLRIETLIDDIELSKRRRITLKKGNGS
jgi:hypothetical protein